MKVSPNAITVSGISAKERDRLYGEMKRSLTAENPSPMIPASCIQEFREASAMKSRTRIGQLFKRWCEVASMEISHQHESVLVEQ